ncbi:MAG TPA: GAF domain-containing protein [Polyangiaceae bacterium]|jgi:hypothetical protein|nr:GAF domain-containing protein [Polyangiaceae bacterium]
MAKQSERGDGGSAPRRKDVAGGRSAADLAKEVESLRATVARLEGEKAALEAAFAKADGERKELSAQFVDGERSHAGIASLYVATDRLHASLDRGEVLVAIQEIITNLIGCEELAVFEVDASGSALKLAVSMGIDEERFASVPLSEGPIGQVASSGTPYFAQGSVKSSRRGKPSVRVAEAEALGLTACVPLKRGEAVTGAIAIFRLLAHKSALTEMDRELLSVLIPHAALALYCCSLQTRAEGGAAGARA